MKFNAEESLQQIERGSFGRLLETDQATLGANLVDVVNQVKTCRNWVAHGRHGAKPVVVSPVDAYRRLGEFLARLRQPT